MGWRYSAPFKSGPLFTILIEVVMPQNYLFTSESVTEGHPDKMCDVISDTILDACLEGDPKSRVACETAVKTGLVLVAGEITTRASLDIPPSAPLSPTRFPPPVTKRKRQGRVCPSSPAF